MESVKDRDGKITERGIRENKINRLLDLYESGQMTRKDLVGLIVSDEEQIIMFAKEVINTAEIDPLTSALNRRGLKSKVDRLDRSRVGYGLFIFDIDNFKKFNDTHGHEIGDIVLQETVAEVATHLREPGKIDLIGRWGGEEFVLVIPGIESSDELRIVGERIRSGVEQRKIFDRNNLLNVTISIGGVLNRDSVSSLVECISEADKLLYKAKQGGRNRVEVA